MGSPVKGILPMPHHHAIGQQLVALLNRYQMALYLVRVLADIYCLSRSSVCVRMGLGRRRKSPDRGDPGEQEMAVRVC